MVIMITALTVSSLVIISLTNISDLIANYQLTESESVTVNMDACLDDAFRRIASSTAVSGSYYVDAGNVTCAYDIDSIITDGIKIVTSTASTTSALGSWYDTVVVWVNVSTTPISIDQYKTALTDYAANNACGDNLCNYGEDCSTCETDCGICQDCGNGVTEGTEVCDDGNTNTEFCGDGDTTVGGCSADCMTNLGLTEVCDDSNANTERCGDGVEQNGSGYCNATCSAEYSLTEQCDYTGSESSPGSDCWSGAVSCKYDYCFDNCQYCTLACPSLPQ